MSVCKGTGATAVNGPCRQKSPDVMRLRMQPNAEKSSIIARLRKLERIAAHRRPSCPDRGVTAHVWHGVTQSAAPSRDFRPPHRGASCFRLATSIDNAGHQKLTRRKSIMAGGGAAHLLSARRPTSGDLSLTRRGNLFKNLSRGGYYIKPIEELAS